MGLNSHCRFSVRYSKESLSTFCLKRMNECMATDQEEIFELLWTPTNHAVSSGVLQYETLRTVINGGNSYTSSVLIRSHRPFRTNTNKVLLKQPYMDHILDWGETYGFFLFFYTLFKPFHKLVPLLLSNKTRIMTPTLLNSFRAVNLWLNELCWRWTTVNTNFEMYEAMETSLVCIICTVTTFIAK